MPASMARTFDRSPPSLACSLRLNVLTFTGRSGVRLSTNRSLMPFHRKRADPWKQTLLR